MAPAMYSPIKPIDVVVLNPADNVCVAARSLEAGSADRRRRQPARARRADSHRSQNCPGGDRPGEPVIKYGQTIGFATARDRAGRLGP